MRDGIRSNPRRREEGMALIVAVLMLVFLGIIGQASMETVSIDRQVAGFMNRTRMALDAADAGLATAMGVLRSNVQGLREGGVAALVTFNPPIPVTNLGQAPSYPYGQPSFAGDPAVPNPIQYMGAGKECPWVMSLDGIFWRKALWEIRVMGQTADGTQTNIQSSASVCHPYNS